MILSIETATRQNCSVALHTLHQSNLIANRSCHQTDNHLVTLATLIDELFLSGEFHYADLKAIAVSAGPGSYTGLRIGVSMAKSLCYSLSIPLVAVSTLYAMAQSRIEDMTAPNYANALLCPMLDARRDEVYTAVYSSEGNEIIPPHAYVLQPESFSSLLKKQPIIFVGNGAIKARHILQSNTNAIFEDTISPQASAVGKIGCQYYQIGAFADVAYFEPYYLKDFIGKTQS